MKKLILLITLIGTITVSAQAQQAVIAQGNCGAQGNNLTWVLTDDGTLTISGNGAMADYTSGTSPWYIYRQQMTQLIIENAVTTIGNYAFYYCDKLTGNLTIPNFVKTIGIYAFQGCSSFTGNLIIGKSITTIGTYAFSECSTLTSIDVDSGNNNYCSDNGVLFNKNKSILVCCPAGKTGNYSIPNSVTTIGDAAFYGCSGLTGTLTISDFVKTIGENAFYNCNGFTGNLIIGNSVENIGVRAFMYCSGFTNNLIISNNVTNIGDRAFWDCNGFNNLIVGNSVAIIGDFAFEFCSSLTSITIHAINPPTLGINIFAHTSKTIPIYITCGTVSDYQNVTGWDYFTNYQSLNLAPTNLTVTQQNANLQISWQNTGAASYEIYRNDTLFATTTTNTYIDNSVIDGENYCYQIKAINDTTCESQLSAAVCKTFNLTGIDNYQLGIDNYELSVYPNPTNGQLSIRNLQLGIYNIEIYDIIGYCIAQFLIPNCQFLIDLDISHLQAGMYFLRIGNQTVKIIKE